MRQVKSGQWQTRRYLRRTFIGASRIMLYCLLALIGAISLLPSAAYAQPTIIAASLPSGQVGTVYYASVTATGGTPPYTWSIVMGTLPSGLTLDPATGLISGFPDTQGTFGFVVKVTDSTAASSQQSCFITIASRPIIFLATGLSQATEGASYLASLTATGGTAPYLWSVVSGALPAGLTLEPTTGTISGVPSRGTAGSGSFAIRVTDSSLPSVSAQQSFIISIQKGSYETIINVGSGLKTGQTKVLVNGQQMATLQGGQSTKFSFDLGTNQIISVEPVVQDSGNERIRYKAEAAELTVNEYSPYASFSYYPEYFIELRTEPSFIGQVTGSGWYREGYTLSSSAPGTMEFENKPDTQYRFSSWTLPNGQTVSDRNLNLSVAVAGTCTANYDTYYKLAFTSPYGEQKESTWYKARSQADWKLATTQVRMSGILGLFGGNLNAVNSSGTAVMDGPRNIAVNWEPDYTLPLILIPSALFLIILGIYGLYILLRGPAAKPSLATVVYQPIIPTYQPMPPPYRPVLPSYYPAPPLLQPLPPPYRTVLPPLYKAVAPPKSVLVKVKGEPSTKISPKTRERLMAQLSELLDNYEQEIRASRQNPRLPGAGTANEQKRLST